MGICKASYNDPCHEIPHEIHSVLAGRGDHVRLTEVRRHSGVVGELFLQRLELGHELFPVGVCPFWDGARELVVGG